MTMKRAWAHALVGVGIIAVSIAVGALVGSQVTSALGMSGLGERLLPAVLVCGLAVGLVILVVRRGAAFSLADIGLTDGRSALRGLVLGLGVTLGAAILVLGLGSLTGLVQVSSVDVQVLGLFLVTNTLVAVLLEALPEELALRGYTLTALLSRHGRVAAILVGAALFIVAAVLAGLLLSLPEVVRTGDLGAVRLTPAGEDPVVYVLFLFLFGCMLGYARLATTSRTIWTCVAAHVSVLTVNRLLLGDDGTTGVVLELTPDGLLLIPVFVTLTLIAFIGLGGKGDRVVLVEVADDDDDAVVSGSRTSAPAGPSRGAP